MVTPKLPFLIFALAWLITSPIGMAASNHRLTVESNLSRDSDDARHKASYLKYRHYLPDSKSNFYWGVGLGNRSIDDNNGHHKFDAATAEIRLPLSSLVTYRLSGSKLQSKEWSPWTADTALIIQPNDRSYTELFAERDIVDTITAISRKNRVATYGISSDYRFTDEFTLVGAAFRQTFDDGNVRDGRVVRLLFEISRYDWIIAELRRKQLEADFNGIGYFSPETQREDLALITLRNTFFSNNMVASLQFGGGKQTINGDIRQALYLVESKFRGWLSQSIGYDNTLGCKNTGDISFGASNDDYRYCYAKLSLHYNW